MLAASPTSVAWIIVAVITIGWLVYLLINSRSVRPEAGSEIELAANRAPYYDDEVLEGRRLERVQLLGVLLLVVVTVGLPLYWIFEPNRQEEAQAGQVEQFEHWGAELFETTENGGFNCAGCHGGMTATGGSAPYALTDPETGAVTQVNWKAPALNTVMYRFSEEEVYFILEYGRPFSPMQAWGTAGGGPMNDQQLETLVAYIRSIQIPRENCGPDDDDPILCESGNLPAEEQESIDQAARTAVEEGEYETYGEALFNLELGSGAFSCARCHTMGWSYDEPGPPGQGAFGWNLTGGSTDSHFEGRQEMIDFVESGSEFGEVYGLQAQGSGRMPGFGAMLTDEQIEAIVDYVRSL